jgi:hypothetical protein
VVQKDALLRSANIKKHEKPNLPPGRTIVSGCGSITETISQFVDHHAKDLVP